MTFASAVDKQQRKEKSVTENGMPMRVSSADYVVDLFFTIGSMRNATMGEKIRAFEKAYADNPDLAVRVLLWARDVRGGAGERKTFRTIVSHLCTFNYELAERILVKIPELGRWDDLLVFFGTPAEGKALELIATALNNKDALCAKWMPRQKNFKKKVKKVTEAGGTTKDVELAAQAVNRHNAVVEKLRNHLGLSHKDYRKLLSSLSSTVEQQMCAGEWGEINYSHVPSIAAKNYRKAFNRHDQDRYQDWLNALTTGTNPEVKVNAGAIFPHDVLSPLMGTGYNPIGNPTLREKQLVEAQWEALPDFMNDAKVLPMVDSSGSMGRLVSDGSTTAMKVAFSLGMYISDKNKGAFKDVILTFSHNPTLMKLEGDLTSKIGQLAAAPWGMNTNIEAAFSKVLDTGIRNRIPQEEMPEVILILSDMQFDSCVSNHDDTIMQNIKRQYKEAGYEVPSIVFWNIYASKVTPVKATKKGTALVSGYSPSLLSSILTSMDDFTPVGIMMKTIMDERYAY